MKDIVERIIIPSKYHHREQSSSKYTSICLFISKNEEVFKVCFHKHGNSKIMIFSGGFFSDS